MVVGVQRPGADRVRDDAVLHEREVVARAEQLAGHPELGDLDAGRRRHRRGRGRREPVEPHLGEGPVGVVHLHVPGQLPPLLEHGGEVREFSPIAPWTTKWLPSGLRVR